MVALDLFSYAGIDLLENAPYKFTKATKKIIKDIGTGITYQGGKKQYSARILQSMADLCPQCNNFVDLFGGGASMSFQALSNGYNVFYNDLDKGISSLIAFLIGRISSGNRSEFGLLPANFYEFVSSEKFREIRDKEPKDFNEFIYREFIMLTYSFGSNRKGYFCTKDKEINKKMGHKWLMFCDYAGAEFFKEYFAKNSYPEVIDDLHRKWLKYKPNEWQLKRQEFAKIILKLEFIRCVNEYKPGFKDFFKPNLEFISSISQKSMADKCNEFAPLIPKKHKRVKVYGMREIKEIQQLQRIEQIQQIQKIQQIQQIERIEQIQQLQRIGQIEQIEQLQQLQRIQRIQQIQQIEQIEHLSKAKLDFSKIKLSIGGDYKEAFSFFSKGLNPNETILYCDPPYRDTIHIGYKELNARGGFDYESFYEFLTKSRAQGFKVFVSEYAMPEPFKEILAIETRSKFSSKKADDSRIEKLFTLDC